MPVSIYKKPFKDEDCTQIAPSKLQLATYTNKKVKIIGSCNLYIIHPDTRCLQETSFYVAGNEGSILISWATSLALSLIKPHEKLDHLPPKGNKNIIYSSADKMKKRDESWFKVHQIKLKTSGEKIADGYSKGEQSHNENGCSKGEQSHNEDKNCQAEKSIIIWPVKPQMDMWSERPAMKSNYKKSFGLNKNCKATTCEYNN